jgi:hypothetical protein
MFGLFWLSDIRPLRFVARLIGMLTFATGPWWAGIVAQRLLRIPKHVFPRLALHLGFWAGLLVAANPKWPRPRLAATAAEETPANLLAVWAFFMAGSAIGIFLTAYWSRKAGRDRHSSLEPERRGAAQQSIEADESH